jgi:hypothetical protein
LGDALLRAEIQPGLGLEIKADALRGPMLDLASMTSWSCSEIEAMTLRRFIWWLEGLPKK